MHPFLKRPRDAGCLSDFGLDELVAGELEGDAKTAATGHLAGCASCAARLGEREIERATFAAEAPPLQAPVSAPAQPLPVRALPARRARSLSLAFGSAAGLIAAAAAVFLYLRVPKPGLDEGADAVRTKGGARLGLYVQRAGAVSQAAPGDTFHPGEVLQFTYTTSAPTHLAVISVDGARRASVYFPLGPRAVEVSPGRDVELSNSTVLDATLGAETAYGLFCGEAIELEAVRAAFEAKPEEPPIPPGCVVDKIAFVKERAP